MDWMDEGWTDFADANDIDINDEYLILAGPECVHFRPHSHERRQHGLAWIRPECDDALNHVELQWMHVLLVVGVP